MNNESELLKKMTELRDQGVLSQEEFEKKKRLILQESVVPPKPEKGDASEAYVQRSLGIWSFVMVGMQLIFYFLILGLFNVDAEWQAYQISVNGIYALTIIGVLLGIVGFMRPTTSYKNLCKYAILSNFATIFITILSIDIGTIIEFG